MLNIALVGNCQVTALARALRRQRAINIVAVADVNCSGSSDFSTSSRKITGKDGVDWVISHQMGEEFSDLSSHSLADRYHGNFLKLTNIYFSGLHPDLTYFGSFGHRVHSPLGDYHSRIVLSSFIKGYSPDQCFAAFTKRNYEKLGYFSQYEASKTELQEKDKTNDLRFAKSFFEITRNELSLLSVNHPTGVVLAEICNLILARFGDASEPMLPSYFPNPLSESTLWPIYPEIGEHHCLPYKTPFLFFPNVDSGAAPMTLEAFVHGSFAMYREMESTVFYNSSAFEALSQLPI